MRILTTVAEMAALEHGSSRGAVFTMGALHAGHVELMRRCRELIGPDGSLIVTVFVNPTQFGDPKDLENYPRTLEADSALCEAAGVDVLFAPTVQEMYPPGVPLPQFSAGWLGSVLEGRSRPGHFDAVASVVHRLLSITQADVTCFGEKDYQQLAVIRQMARDLDLPVEIVGAPTMREAGMEAQMQSRQIDADSRRNHRANSRDNRANGRALAEMDIRHNRQMIIYEGHVRNALELLDRIVFNFMCIYEEYPQDVANERLPLERLRGREQALFVEKRVDRVRLLVRHVPTLAR